MPLLPLKIPLSVFDGVTNQSGVSVSFGAVITHIRDGENGLADKTRILNVLYQTDKAAYDKRKTTLPAVTWSGLFRGRKELIKHSGLCVVDLDDVSDIGGVFLELRDAPFVFCAFVSPSGAGVKVIMPVSPVPNDDSEHKAAYRACVEVLKETLSLEDACYDTGGSDVNRLCFLAHYPQVIVNENAVAISWEITEEEHEKRTAPKTEWTGPVDITALDYIDAEDYEVWYQVGLACFRADLEMSVWVEWSERSEMSAQNTEAMYLSKWRSFAQERDHKITWGSVVHLAKQNGYEVPVKFSRRPVKLQKNVVSVLTETIDKSRAFLKSVFENKNIKFFGLRADTGVGKNEAAITYFLRGVAGLLTVPTTDLAVEMESRLNAAEVAGVFRYRGILSNPDELFPDENPCIHARRYDAIANRGWNAYQLLCEHCEVRATCEELGYRSQVEQAKQAQVTVMPFPDIFLNPAFRTLAKDYLPTYHEDLILHDEFDPYNAFIEINVPKTRLVQLRDDWEGYDPSAFAKKLLHILEVEGDLPQLRSVVMGLTDAERESILEGFTCVLWNGQILSREDAHRCDAFRAPLHTVEGIHSLPKLETEEWNLIVQLETFFDRYKRDADMPMTYENDTLTFLLPPLPMHTRARMGFMSATLDETLFRRAMDSRQLKRGDVSFHDTGLTEWHPEARVYQLRTNRNPRGTAYTPKGERVDGELLSSTGEFYWGLVAEDLKLPRRGLITYKALIAEKADDMEGIPTANFGGLVGLDTAFKGVDVLHILFSPEVPPSAIERKAKALFGNDTELLCYDRDENGQYIDKRLQACYDDGVIAELIQAIGRSRGVSRPVTVVIWCSHSLPGITDREQTILFDETDWRQAGGDLEKLQGVVAVREQAEQSGDLDAVMGSARVSERTAYRRTAETRKQNKAERDAEIRSRSANGETQQQIADALGIGLATVNRVRNA